MKHWDCKGACPNFRAIERHAANPEPARNNARRAADVAPTVVVLASVVVALVAAGAAKPGAGRFGWMGQDASPPPSEQGVHDVYVDDSFESRDALSRAGVLQAAGRWEEAAQTLQETSERYAAMLTPTEANSYVTIRTHVARLICAWPGEGLAAWRRLYEARADLALHAGKPGDSIGARLDPWELYFPSAAAGRETATLAESAIEEGRLVLAQRLYTTALRYHPDRARHESQWRSGLALIEAIRGNPDGARTMLEEHPGSNRVRWMGEEREVSSLLAEASESFAGMRDVESADFPASGLTAQRSGTASCDIDEPGLLWRHFFECSESSGARPEAVDDVDPLRAPAVERIRQLSIHPLLVGNLVIFQRRSTLIATQARSGAVVWETAQGEPSEHDAGESGPMIEAPCALDGRLYAVVPEHAEEGERLEAQPAQCALVCLLTADGREQWRRRPQEFGDDHAGITFESAPLATEDHIFIVARRRRAFGFEDCYLYRLRRADGAFLSRAHLGSASTGSFGYRRSTFSMSAVDSGLILVCTQLGTVAAIHEVNGSVAWLRLYPQSPRLTRMARSSSSEVSPWQFGPPRISGDRVVILPTDCDDLLVLRTEDGALIARASRERLGGADHLVGMTDRVVVTSGATIVASDARTLAPLWSASLPEGVEQFGRGAVLRDRVLIPTPRSLCSFKLADGTRTERRWDAEGEGGNLVPLTDELVVAGDERVSAYLRREDIWQRMRDRMAAAPDDLEPALDFAEAVMRDGDLDETEHALNEAYARGLRGSQSPDPALRGRFHRAVLLYAERSQRAARLTVDRLNAALEWAAACAVSPDMHVEQRLRFSEWFEGLGDIERAVRLQQQILLDRSLRPFECQPRGGWKQPAGQVAERNIARLLAVHGTRPYAAFEGQAASALEAARVAHDPALLERLIESFPNSETAPLALRTLGEWLVELSRPLEAARCLTEAYYRYPKALNRPDLMFRIAEAWRKGGRVEAAYGWLTKGAREFPGVWLDVDGRRETFIESRGRLDAAGASIGVHRPALKLPLRSAFAIEFAQAPTLLSPAFADHSGLDASTLLVHVEEEIQCVSAADGKRVWSWPLPVAGGPRLLTRDEAQFVIATAHEVTSLDARTGALRWSIGRPPSDRENPARDWEGIPVFSNFALYGQRLLCVRDDARATCVDIRGGAILWERSIPKPAGRDLACSEDHVCYAGSDGRRSVWVRLPWDGKEAPQSYPIEEIGPILRVLSTFDGQIILASAERIAAVDPITGAIRWVASPGGRLRDSAIIADFDGLYVSTDGRSVTKIGLGEGREQWRSVQVAMRGDEGMSLDVQSGNVIVSDVRGVVALDGLTGQLLWKGTTPERCQLVFRAVARDYFVALDVRNPGDSTPPRAFLYDHRNASGLLPKDGVVPLELSSEFTAGAVCEHALVVLTGTRLQGWVDADVTP